jgi:hypothetical protein
LPARHAPPQPWSHERYHAFRSRPEGRRIVAAYVNAFAATLNDPQYRAEFARIDPDSPVASKAEFRELAKVSSETLDYIQAELKRQGFGAWN